MGQAESNQVISLDQLPSDPLSMPPPYWRIGGAIFHIHDALENLVHLLNDLIAASEHTEFELVKYYEDHPEESDDLDLVALSEICNDFWTLELQIKLKARSAILMSAIQAEDDINKFCVYNLHKDIAESIEKLSPPEKLLIASASVGETNTKSSAVFETIKKLTKWRNAFAHGHPVDRPAKSLRHRHLISPSDYPTIPDTIKEVKELVGGYVKIEEFLRTISLNPYTASSTWDVEHIEDCLNEIARFRFKASKYLNRVFTVEYSDAA